MSTLAGSGDAWLGPSYGSNSLFEGQAELFSQASQSVLVTDKQVEYFPASAVPAAQPGTNVLATFAWDSVEDGKFDLLMAGKLSDLNTCSR